MKRFMKALRIPMIALLLVAGAIVVTGEMTAYASNVDQVQNGIDAIGGDKDGNRPGAFTNLLERIINVLLFLIGAIAVIMIIIGGIRYVTSNGDQAQVTGAKNTILYAVVGVVVAIMAYAIVNFVVDSL